ncbi:putative acetyltransferase [Sinomicrobium oceani]|uniref:Putative acetyltransferase n=1 Tax=Sinomicrobium oceani TaxID=1150368 RepID=A0A1K1QIS7_9FLAO|nr:GNAT family N-acetyltransferase [Sinomicrobium oceani]SFW59569.1 putative acetyltransferase [Sinomicrobium oceani]
MKDTYVVVSAEEEDFDEIVEVWEASVRATHHFLKEEDIGFFRPLIRSTYLKMLDVRVIKGQDDSILAFTGISGSSIEMLFIHPDTRGTGLGKKLLNYAIAEAGAFRVDVNEANFQARGFYEYMGFKVTGRSELDSTGKPYPILHMELNSMKHTYTTHS